MQIIHLELSGNTGASLAADAVAAGSLWGVELGTTSKVAGYADSCIIVATETRVSALSQHLIDVGEAGVLAYSIREEMAFSSLPAEEAIAYLLGKADT